MSNSVNNQLKRINNIILDYILESPQFKLYLKNVFETLGNYAGKLRRGQDLFLFYYFILI